MSIKRKISWRKILQAVTTLVVTVACCMAILSAAKVQYKRKIKDVDIDIVNERYRFIDKAEIEHMLKQYMRVTDENLAKLNVHKIEDTISAIPWIDKAQVYIDNAKTLHVSVLQRVPVARVFDRAGNSYYIDRELKAMPLSDKYIHYTTVVTNVPVFTNDTLDRDFKAQIAAMVKFIDGDSFWSAQVSQIMVTDSLEFELMPVLGNHIIRFGDTTRLNKKFSGLFAFYKNILNRVGWDKYEVLDIRYARQVVASPALPWKVPADKAAANMDWVKSIIGEDTQQHTRQAVVVTNSALTANTPAKNVTPVNPPVQQAQQKPAKQQAVADEPGEKQQTGVKQKIMTADAGAKEQAKPKYIYKGE